MGRLGRAILLPEGHGGSGLRPAPHLFGAGWGKSISAPFTILSQLRVTSGVLELCCTYEILTGRRSLERNRPRTEQKLLERVKKQFPLDSERFGWPLYPNGFLIDMFNALKKEDFKVFSIVLWSRHNGRNSAQFGSSHRKLEEWNPHDIGKLKTTFGGVDFVEVGCNDSGLRTNGTLFGPSKKKI
ncbi:hypothetical protein TorRG33x02_078680 [Trema orientale]|uniref:Uncharacterized protein n=1 Tax=Trema orientale TaxID=63057 RepID=A0A2P5FES6_TREOI|nr:hypothetical protein TorRG33x02_078680 [Trema orientale]